MLKTKLSKKPKRKMVIPKHDRHCSYWAGCNPFSGEEGYCGCGLSETKSELELHVIVEEAPESLKSASKR